MGWLQITAIAMPISHAAVAATTAAAASLRLWFFASAAATKAMRAQRVRAVPACRRARARSPSGRWRPGIRRRSRPGWLDRLRTVPSSRRRPYVTGASGSRLTSPGPAVRARRSRRPRISHKRSLIIRIESRCHVCSFERPRLGLDRPVADPGEIEDRKLHDQHQEDQLDHDAVKCKAAVSWRVAERPYASGTVLDTRPARRRALSDARRRRSR